MKIKPSEIIILSIAAAIMIFLYVGFFFPDEFLLRRPGIKLLLYSIRLLFPFLAAGLIWTYFSVRNKKIDKKNILLLAASVIVSLIIALHAGIAYHSFREGKNDAIRQFHPFLQLMPNPVDTKALQDTGACRIVCIGGSTTEFKDKNGVGWPEYLDGHIKKEKGFRKVKVINCGRQWYSSLHMLLHYQTNIRPYRPNVIIVMEAINDLLHNADRSYFSGGKFRSDYGHFYGPVNRVVRPSGFFKEYFCEIFPKLWYQKPREVLELDSFPGLHSYRRNLQAIIDLALIDGTKVVLMTQPALFKENLSEGEKRLLVMVNIETVGERTRWSYATARRGMEQYNTAMRSIAAERGVDLIDLEKIVPKTAEYFHDDVHYQDRAYPLIVKTLANALISKSLIDVKFKN